MSAGRIVRDQAMGRISRGVWGTVLLTIVACGALVGQAADEAADEAGLRGLLPTGTPVELTVAISTLPENWAAWGAALTTDLENLYEKDDLDLAGQRKAIAALRARLKTVETSLADSRYRSMKVQLVSLRGGLSRRIDLAEAALATLSVGPEVKAARLEAARAQVVRAADVLNNYLGTLRNGDGWVKYMQVSEVRSQVGSDPGKSTPILTAVQTRLKGKTEVADERARGFMQRTEFSAYERAVDEYLAILNNATASSNSPELRTALGELLQAVDTYESSRGSSAAGAVRRAFDKVRTTAPDGGEKISQVLRNHYFNYNFRMVASEDFLNKFVATTRQQNGEVRDYILGADVYGNQTTVTQVAIDLVPSSQTVQFDIAANGAVSSNTVGVTEQANIYTWGNHYFWAAKRVLFDGEKFWSQPARISVSANNTTTDAETEYSDIPLIGGITNRIAMRAAQKKRPESEAIAASRVQDKVIPEFNSEVDKEFGPGGTANNDIGPRLAALQELRLYPDAKVWSSTDTEMRLAARIMSNDELGGSDPHPSLVLGRGTTILLHESWMNNAADRLDLKGQTLSDDQLRARLETNLSKLLGREFKFSKSDKPENDEEATKLLAFDSVDPIRFQISGGTLLVTLRTGIKQEGKEDVPPQSVTVPLTFSVDQKNVIIERGNVGVASIGDVDNPAQQLARAGVIRSKIEKALGRREIDRVGTVEHDLHKIMVAVTRIRALDGWLSITVE
jgi:hypothetical protein